MRLIEGPRIIDGVTEVEPSLRPTTGGAEFIEHRAVAIESIEQRDGLFAPSSRLRFLLTGSAASVAMFGLESELESVRQVRPLLVDHRGELIPASLFSVWFFALSKSGDAVVGLKVARRVGARQKIE